MDEFCEVTKQHRKHVIRLLNGPAPGAGRPPRTRDVRYERATIDALQKIWPAAGYPWSVRPTAPVGLLPGAGDPVHPRAPLQEG